MTNKPTGNFKLSKQEAMKSARDAALIALGGLLPQLFEIVSNTDFGEYTTAVSLICAMVLPLLNRFLSSDFMRIK